MMHYHQLQNIMGRGNTVLIVPSSIVGMCCIVFDAKLAAMVVQQLRMDSAQIRKEYQSFVQIVIKRFEMFNVIKNIKTRHAECIKDVQTVWSSIAQILNIFVVTDIVGYVMYIMIPSADVL